MGISYIVTISDISPFCGGGNKLDYKFSSRRKAFKFMEDAMSRGYYVSVYTVNVPHVWDEMPEDEYGR